MFCPFCGALIKDGSKFCESCGAQLNAKACARQDDGAYVGAYARENPLTAGFSRLIDSEPVRIALEKQQRATRIALVILIALPLIGFAIYGALSDSMTMVRALLTGAVVSVVFAIASLIVTLKKKLEKPFEGTVADKKTVRRYKSSKHGSPGKRTEYFLYVTDDDGKRRKKSTTATVFDFLQVGDRVRYLPEFPQPFEKYDKSGDTKVLCMFCGQLSSPDGEACSLCRNPLIR